MDQKRSAYKILMEKNLGNDQFEERNISGNNTQMDRMEAGDEDGWRVKLAQDRAQRRTLVLPVLGCSIILAVGRQFPLCGPGSIPIRIMWDQLWKKRKLSRFSPSTSDSPANSHSTKCSILIYHAGLMQWAH
jgi:hypothetical protein